MKKIGILVFTVVLGLCIMIQAAGPGRSRYDYSAAGDINGTDVTYVTEIQEYYTVETTEIVIKGKGNSYYQINFDLNDVNFLLTESTDYDRTVVMSSNTVDFEQLIVDANLVVNQELDVNGVATFNGDTKFTNSVAYTYDPNQGDTGATETIDWTTGNKFMVIASDNVTFTFTAPDVGTVGSAALQLLVVQDGVGSRAITWPATLEWPADTEATETTTAGDGDVFNMLYIKTSGVEKYLVTSALAFNLDD